MTALKPIENRRVRGVASERYPLNEKCAHPECNEPAADPHHIFPRSEIIGDSYFVELTFDHADEARAAVGDVKTMIVMHPNAPGGGALRVTIPHVSGLCRAHHDDVEEHRAWIKLEEGVFVWYLQVPPSLDELERWERETGESRDSYPLDSWSSLGPLNPQPGSREGKPKRKPRGQARAGTSQTWTLRAPKDESMEPFFELLGQAQLEVQKRQESDKLPPPYITLVAVLADWLT